MCFLGVFWRYCFLKVWCRESWGGWIPNVQSLASKLTSAPGRAADITIALFMDQRPPDINGDGSTWQGQDHSSIQYMDWLVGFGVSRIRSFLKPIENCRTRRSLKLWRFTTTQKMRFVWMLLSSWHQSTPNMFTNSQSPNGPPICTLGLPLVVGFRAFSGQWLFWTILPVGKLRLCHEKVATRNKSPTVAPIDI